VKLRKALGTMFSKNALSLIVHKLFMRSPESESLLKTRSKRLEHVIWNCSELRIEEMTQRAEIRLLAKGMQSAARIARNDFTFVIGSVDFPCDRVQAAYLLQGGQKVMSPPSDFAP
jgi:hypothetical protein